MGKLALVHAGRATVLPPRELVEPYIERTPNHWYWLGEFYEDALDRSAEFRWAAPAEKTTRFMVPRLLWQYEHAESLGKRVLLENVCGLFTCINPAHWRTRQGTSPNPARILLSEDGKAWPAVQGQDLVTVHIQLPHEQDVLCDGRPLYRNLPKTTVVTCDECIGAWLHLGLPYTEVT